jgi:hypothetical protein
MSEYTPDSWVVLKIVHGEEQPVYKVLAGWGGSYLYGASWKLNSGITRVEEDGQCYLFHGYSGSVYRCHKSSQRLSAYTAGILANFQKQAEESNSKLAVELLPEETNFMEIISYEKDARRDDDNSKEAV